MANAGGSSLAKSGDSRSVAEKFAEARVATRAPGFGAAAFATMRRQAEISRDASAARVDENLTKVGYRTRIWKGSKVQETGVANRGRVFDEGMRVYVSEARGSGRSFRGYKDLGYVSIHRDGSRHYDGLTAQKGTIRNIVEG